MLPSGEIEICRDNESFIEMANYIDVELDAMPITRSHRFSYQRTPATWQINTAWRARRSKMTQTDLNNSSIVHSGLTTAWNNQVSGAASLAAQAAVDRIYAATSDVKKSALSVDLSA